MDFAVESKSISLFRNDSLDSSSDFIAVEEPLEIRMVFWQETKILEKSIAITMRTPGHERELALGFLLGEGIIASCEDVLKTSLCAPKPPAKRSNVIRIELQKNCTPKMSKLERHFYTTSSCGVCGKASIEALGFESAYHLPDTDIRFDPRLLLSLPAKLRQSQEVFKKTGGLHGAGFFNLKGELLSHFEDVGRHNALDKLIGNFLLLEQLPLQNGLLLVSGRTSFELVQKACMAGVLILGGIGAPSSLAVELAQERGMTLFGFLKRDGFNIYSHPQRLEEEL